MQHGVGRLKGPAKGRDGGVEAANEFVKARADGSFQFQTASLQTLGVVLGKRILVGEKLLEK